MLDMEPPIFEVKSMIHVYVKNLQSIKEYMFTFPDHGIVQFFGDNSNGKSILSKTLSAVVLQKLRYDDERLPLINDGESDALFGIEYDGKQLVVVISRNMDNCIYQLTRADGQKVIRKLLDDGIDEMLREFGFLIYDKRRICLQFCETFGAMPFINTSDQANGEIVNSVITDIPSEQFIESYKVTFNEAKAMMKQYVATIDSYQKRLEMIRPINTDGFEELSRRMKRCFEINRIVPHVDEINVDFLPVLHFDMAEVKELEESYIPYFIDYQASTIMSFDLLFDELNKIERGVCPTCGRRYVEELHGECCR